MRFLLVTLLGCLLAAGVLGFSRVTTALRNGATVNSANHLDLLQPDNRTAVTGRPTLPTLHLPAPTAALPLAAAAFAHRPADTTLPLRR